MFALLVFALLSGGMLANASAPPVQPSGSSIYSLSGFMGEAANFAQYAAPAMMICVAIAALAYMIGQFLDMPSVKAQAKVEVQELGSTLVIFAFILAALAAYALVAQALYPNITYTNTDGHALPPTEVTGTSGNLVIVKACKFYLGNPDSPNPPTIFSMADFFLGCPLIGDNAGGVLLPRLSEIYVSLMELEFLLGVLSTLGMSINVPTPITILPGLSMSFHAGLGVISDAHTLIVDAIGFAIGLVTAQKVVLQFVYTSVLKFILPFGILLRALPFSRKTGSTVIAVCMVFYFVYPASIMINKYMFDTYLQMGVANSASGGPALGAPGSDFVNVGKRIDFVNFTDVIRLCQDRSGVSDFWKTHGIESLEEYKNDIYRKASDDVEAVSPSHTRGRTNAALRFGASALSAFNMVANLNTWAGVIAFLVPASPLLGAFFYDAITHELIVATQFLSWNFVFLVNSVVISLTLFKDISLAIGGEIRIFGITKVV